MAQRGAEGMAGDAPCTDVSFCSVWPTTHGSVLFKLSGFALMT